MITINKVVESPKLVITHDQNPESPREWSNLGYFITRERNYNSPDTVTYIMDIIEDTAEEATDIDNHMDLITKRIDEESDGEKVLAIYPINRYEHGEVVYSLGVKHGWDYSNCGFYIVTDKTTKELEAKAEDFEKIIKQELDVYNKYANGEVYGYILYGEDGDIDDSCWGFYDIKDIKDHLPAEFDNEDLSEYLQL